MDGPYPEPECSACGDVGLLREGDVFLPCPKCKPQLAASSGIIRSLQEQLAAARAETEQAILDVIDERDQAEDALMRAYELVCGHLPEWSNNFGYDQALDDIHAAMTQQGER